MGAVIPLRAQNDLGMDVDAPVQEHQCRILEARSRLRIGEPDEAVQLLETAEAFFTPIGGRYFVDMIEELRSEAAA